MGRIKRKYEYLYPFCYHCDKVFPNEIVLHMHQKAKHFTCNNCKKKFSTASSLQTHASTVHKETLTKVNNALNNRDSIDMNIFGMQGVPPSIVQERNLMGAREYWTRVYQGKQQKIEQERKRNQKPSKKDKFKEDTNRKQDDTKYYQEKFESEKPIQISFSQPVCFNIGGLNKNQRAAQ